MSNTDKHGSTDVINPSTTEDCHIMSIIKKISELPSHPDPVIMEPDLTRVHEIFEKLADRHGKMFTVQFADQLMMVVADAKILNFIVCKRPELFGPYRRNSRILEAIKTDGIETADGHDWKRQREIIAASMESIYLAQYFETIKAAVEALRNRWITYGENLAEINLEAEIFGFSISVFTSIMFGDMADMPADEREAAESLMFNLVSVLGKRIDALLPQMHLENISEDKDFEEAIKKLLTVIENRIAHSRNILAGNNKTGKIRSQLQVLMETIEKEGLANHDVKLTENILQLLLAAEPTTADTLLRVLHCIAENPQAQKDIQDEVYALLGDCSHIEDFKDIKKLKCIDAVILETMRIASSSRLVLVEAKTDLLLEDIEVPSGTPLVLLIAYCGLDAENFHQAAVFDHRRWQRESKAESEPHNSKAALGFGAGPRSCPGRGLAMLVMKTVLAMICANFQIRRVPETPLSNETMSKHQPFSLGFTLKFRDRHHDFIAIESREIDNVY